MLHSQLGGINEILYCIVHTCTCSFFLKVSSAPCLSRKSIRSWLSLNFDHEIDLGNRIKYHMILRLNPRIHEYKSALEEIVRNHRDGNQHLPTCLCGSQSFMVNTNCPFLNIILPR